MVLIGVMGKKRHGKDTVGDYITNRHNFDKTAFAKPLKDMCRIGFLLTDDELNGCNKEIKNQYWGKSTREILQFVGTEMFREKLQELMPELGSDFWVRRFQVYYESQRKLAEAELETVRPVLEKYSKRDDVKSFLRDLQYNCVVTDVRFQNECDIIKQLGGIVIKVDRPGLESNDEHVSEKTIDSITGYDYKIVNDGSFDDLHHKIEKVLENIGF